MWMRILTTPPPPRRELFAAFTIDVAASFVISVRMSEILELSDAEGVETSLPSDFGWSSPRRYNSDNVGIDEICMEEVIFRVLNLLRTELDECLNVKI